MRFSRRILLVATAAVIGTLVVVACGGSSNTSDNGGGQKTVTVTRIHTITIRASVTTTTAPLTPTTATKTTTTAIATGTACTASDLTPTFLGSNGAAGTIELGFGAQEHRQHDLPHVRLARCRAAVLRRRRPAHERHPHDDRRAR